MWHFLPHNMFPPFLAAIFNFCINTKAHLSYLITVRDIFSKIRFPAVCVSDVHLKFFNKMHLFQKWCKIGWQNYYSSLGCFVFALQKASLSLAKQYSTFYFSFGYKRMLLIVSPDESRGYFGFSTVTPPPQRFPFGRDNLKNILVRTFKFGMWVYMGNATNAIVLWPWPSISRSLVAS